MTAADGDGIALLCANLTRAPARTLKILLWRLCRSICGEACFSDGSACHAACRRRCYLIQTRLFPGSRRRQAALQIKLRSEKRASPQIGRQAALIRKAKENLFPQRNSQLDRASRIDDAPALAVDLVVRQAFGRRDQDAFDLARREQRIGLDHLGDDRRDYRG
jgi:hypothetical protein